jgi:hypothetical protein
VLTVEGKRAAAWEGAEVLGFGASTVVFFGAFAFADVKRIDLFAPSVESIAIWWLLGMSLMLQPLGILLGARGAWLVGAAVLHPDRIEIQRPARTFIIERDAIAAYVDDAPDHIRLMPRRRWAWASSLVSYRYVIPTLSEFDRVAVLRHLDSMGIPRR